VKIHRFTNSSKQVHGFLVKSTAPINVEDQNDDIIDEDVKREHPDWLEDSNINQIANILTSVEAPEVIVRIHGYSTKEKM